MTCGIRFLYVFEIETVREGNERRDIAENGDGQWGHLEVKRGGSLVNGLMVQRRISSSHNSRFLCLRVSECFW